MNNLGLYQTIVVAAHRQGGVEPLLNNVYKCGLDKGIEIGKRIGFRKAIPIFIVVAVGGYAIGKAIEYSAKKIKEGAEKYA